MFLHDFYPSPIIVDLDWLKLRWYGLIVITATLAGWRLVVFLNKKYKNNGLIILKNKDQISDLYFFLVIFGLLGARIYEVLVFWQFYWSQPSEIVKIWHGGLAIHGALIGGILTIIWFVKKQKLNLGLVLDLLAPAIALGQGIGRWGNYFNQELFGLPTNLPWGIPIDLINRPAGYENFTYFHPTFLYESILNLILFGFLLYLHRKRLEKTKTASGFIALVYLIGYSLIRFSLEFIKIDETPIMFGLRWPQVISLLIVGVVGYLLFKIKNFSGNTSPNPSCEEGKLNKLF